MKKLKFEYHSSITRIHFAIDAKTSLIRLPPTHRHGRLDHGQVIAQMVWQICLSV